MFLSFLKFFIPISLWLFLFWGLLSGAVPLQSEPFGVYAMVKFYLDYFRIGIIPLWQPFLLWGFPWQIILNYFGFANPIWLVTLLLSALGIKIYFAFLYTVILYFLIGQLGFYFLAKAILRDKRAAYIAFLLLLFSSIGLVCISQFNMLLIFVPAIWFFYFLVRFCQRWDTLSWAGMVLTLMLIAQAYLPFYFLTVLLLAALIFVLVNPGASKTTLVGVLQFFHKRIFLVILSAVALTCSLLPAYLAYRSTTTHEVVIPWRHKGTEVFTQGSTFVNYKKTTEGGLGSRISLTDMFSDPDQLVYANDGFFFVSGFAFLILLLGAFNPMNRRILFFTLLFAILFTISLGNSTPVHRFFFEHVFYFKLIRNMHFFLPFLLAIVVLVTAEQARLLLQWVERINARQRIRALLVILIVHAGFWIFLHSRLDINWAMHATFILSFIFCILALYPSPRWNPYGQTLLVLACLLLQPVTVINGHNHLLMGNFSPAIKKGMGASLKEAQFSFERKQGEDIALVAATPKEQLDHYYLEYLSKTDAQAKELDWEQGAPAFWSYYFFKNFPKEVIQEYSRYKIALYDSVELIPSEKPDLSGIVKAFENQVNVVFITADHLDAKKDLDGLMSKRSALKNSQMEFVTAASPELNVHYFDANTLRLTTNFSREKFLVYNDSFVPGWEAWCNGVKVPLYRANIAFKGLKLPAGHNEIVLVYRPTGRILLIVSLMILCWGTFLYVLIMSLRQGKPRS